MFHAAGADGMQDLDGLLERAPSSVTDPSMLMATIRSSGTRVMDRSWPTVGTLTLIRLSASLNLLPTMKKITSRNTTSIMGVRLIVASSRV